MKALIIISLLTIIFSSTQGQNENSFFKYEKVETSKRLWKATPKIDKLDFNGKHTASTILNDEYFVDLFATIAKKCFTKDEIELLDTKGYRVHFMFIIDKEGNFRWCEFRLTKLAIDQIGEKSLVKFYKSVMSTKLDTAKWGENAGKYDFIHLSYGVNPKGVDKLNKWRSEQKSKK